MPFIIARKINLQVEEAVSSDRAFRAATSPEMKIPNAAMTQAVMLAAR